MQMEMGKKEDIANEKKLSEVELAQIKYLSTKTLLLRILIGVVILFIILFVAAIVGSLLFTVL